VRDVLVFLYSFAAVSTIFFVRLIGLNVLQLPIEVVYLIIGVTVIVYIVFGYMIFIRKRK
jgi:purine-cytosine permease-like protein